MTALDDVDAARSRLADYVASLTLEQLRMLEDSMLRSEDKVVVGRAIAAKHGLGWRATPLGMGVHLGHLRWMAHTELLSEKFVDAFEGRSTRQIWNLPPRYGKSMIASQWAPLWAFDRDPTIKMALCSYGDKLAQENSSIVRNLLAEHSDVLACQLRRDRRRNDRFTTEQGGGLIAAGVGSALSGFGAHGIIVDDAQKDWQEAHSESRREAVWNWYRSVARTRLENRPNGMPGFIICVQTRWHEEDLSGHLLASDDDEWELVRLPAIAEEDDALGRQVGEALAPSLFTLDNVLSSMRDLGSYLAAGLYQQRPAPEEGTDIMRGWWRYADAFPPQFDDTCTSTDCKMKDKEGGDFVVIQAWGRTGSDYWLIDQLRGQWNFAMTKAAIALMHVRHPHIGAHIIENTGNGPEVMAELRKPQPGYTLSESVRGQLGMIDVEVESVQRVMRNGMTGLVGENPKGDKRARMRAQTPKIEAGNVHLPSNASWVPAFVDEMAAFPGASVHDDQVDACSQALKRLSNSFSSVSGPPSHDPIKMPKPGARSSGVLGNRGRGVSRVSVAQGTIGRPKVRR